MKLTSQEKKEVYQAMVKEGFSREAIQNFFSTVPPEALRAILVNVRAGLPVLGSGKPDKTPVKDLNKVRKGAKQEALSFLDDYLEQPVEVDNEKAKTVLYSFKVGISDLEALKTISKRDGDSVAVLIRQAIRSYLAVKGVRR